MKDLTTVTYHFADNTKQISNINKEMLVNERGRQRSMEELNKIFLDIQHDLGAISFEL